MGEADLGQAAFALAAQRRATRGSLWPVRPPVDSPTSVPAMPLSPVEASAATASYASELREAVGTVLLEYRRLARKSPQPKLSQLAPPAPPQPEPLTLQPAPPAQPPPLPPKPLAPSRGSAAELAERLVSFRTASARHSQAEARQTEAEAAEAQASAKEKAAARRAELEQIAMARHK